MMKKVWFVFLLIVVLSLKAWSQDAQKITTFIVVRHAEKSLESSKDPELAPEGVGRAQKLAEMLRDVQVSAIYSTNYKRTRNTVTPLANMKGVDVQVYESFKEDGLDELIEKYPGGTIIISGHSNTVPGIVNLLVGGNQYKNLEDSNYSTMFLVAVATRGKVATVTQLQY